MCYPCTQCGRCGKYNEDSIFYVPPADIPCLQCGGIVDPVTGICTRCGDAAFVPVGQSAKREDEREAVGFGNADG